MDIDPALVRAAIAAFLDDGPERTYYYDRDSARIVSISEDQADSGAQIVWQLESDTRGRFVPVPKPRLEETLDEQDQFVEHLPDGKLKKQLEALIENDPDGSKMAQFVIRDKEARNAWRRFRSIRAEERARAFLADLA